MKLSECRNYLELEDGDIIPEGCEVLIRGRQQWELIRHDSGIGKKLRAAWHARRLPIEKWRGLFGDTEYCIVRSGPTMPGDRVVYYSEVETVLQSCAFPDGIFICSGDGLSTVDRFDYSLVFRVVGQPEEPREQRQAFTKERTLHLSVSDILDAERKLQADLTLPVRVGIAQYGASPEKIAAVLRSRRPKGTLLCALCHKADLEVDILGSHLGTREGVVAHKRCLISSTRLQRVLAKLEDDPYKCSFVGDKTLKDDPERTTGDGKIDGVLRPSTFIGAWWSEHDAMEPGVKVEPVQSYVAEQWGTEFE